MFDYYLFDLDGTITDSFTGIANSVTYALEKLNRPEIPVDELKAFVGPPLIESFTNVCGMNRDEAQAAVTAYREYYAEYGLYENRPYDGIEETFEKLKRAGKRLLVATAKPEKFTVKILSHFGLLRYFDHIAGATMDSSRINKPEIIAYALSSANITEKTRAVMIGDRKHDVLGAKQNAIMSAGVLFGYGSRKELEEAGADFIIQTTTDLTAVLLKPL